MKRVISVLLVIVGFINFAPVIGVISAEALVGLYGINEPAGDLLILLRHRALLFGIIGFFIITSAFKKNWQPLAMAAGFVSMTGFIALASAEGSYGQELAGVIKIDLIALMLLIVSIVLHYFKKARREADPPGV